MEELTKNADPNIVIALVGNKSDLEDQRRISTEEAKKFCEENGLLYFECSAKTGANVREVFISVMEKIPIFEKANFSLENEQIIFEKKFSPPKKCDYKKCMFG